MSFAVEFGPVARTNIETIHDWWVQNRPSAVDLFQQELDDAVDMLRLLPEVGLRYPYQKIKGLRRLLLRATRYHVYYVFDGSLVTIVSVWSAVRGRGPDLR